jgi:hypothetical protein
VIGRGEVVVVGDVGGHPDVLRACVAAAGGDAASLWLPENVQLVQVGDLVRCSAAATLDNDACVRLAAEGLRVNGDRWVQLAGNHDLALLGGPARPEWAVDGVADTSTIATLRGLWQDGRLRLAVALDTEEYGPVLVTHAGLTRARWLALGAPEGAPAAAEAVNTDVGGPVPDITRAGALVDGTVDELADVTWAEVNAELYDPWLAAGDVPFTQVHGHASPVDWATGRWWPAASPAIRSATAVDPERRRTVIRLGRERVAIGVDWRLGDRSPGRIWPLLRVAGASAG